MAVLGGRGLRNLWPVMFLLGVIMLNHPFLHIFDQQVTILGIPLLFYYLFVGWLASISVIFIYRIILDRTSKGRS